MTTEHVLYVIPECPHCERARQHLRSQGVEWEERDATTRAEWRAELMAYSGGSGTVPTLVHDGRVVSVGWHGVGCHIGHFEQWGPGPPPGPPDH